MKSVGAWRLAATVCPWSTLREITIDCESQDHRGRVIKSLGDSVLFISDDAGRTWRREEGPGIVQSIAKGRFSTEYAMATESGVYLSINGTEINIAAPSGRITDLQSARQMGGKNGLCFFGSAGSHSPQLLPTRGTPVDVPRFGPRTPWPGTSARHTRGKATRQWLRRTT